MARLNVETRGSIDVIINHIALIWHDIDTKFLKKKKIYSHKSKLNLFTRPKFCRYPYISINGLRRVLVAHKYFIWHDSAVEYVYDVHKNRALLVVEQIFLSILLE